MDHYSLRLAGFPLCVCYNDTLRPKLQGFNSDGGAIYPDIVRYAAVLGTVFANLDLFFLSKKDR